MKQPRYCSLVEQRGARTIAGHVFDPENPLDHVVIELQVDGVSVALARAEIFVEALYTAHIGDGRYGFAFVLPPEVVEQGGLAQVAIANRGIVLSPSIILDPLAAPADHGDGAGFVAWGGGLLLSGWLNSDAADETVCVRCVIDGELVSEVVADRWHHRRQTNGARPVPAFALHLPSNFADGRSRRVRVTDGRGSPLRGSPVTLLALPEPLETCAARAYGPDSGLIGIRARLFDQLLPQMLPLTQFNDWLDRYPAPRPQPASAAVVLVGDEPGDVARSLASLQTQADLDWVAAVLPSPDRVSFNSSEFASFLSLDARDYCCVLLAPTGAKFLPGAPGRLANALSEAPEAPLVYGDVALGTADNETALGFPAFDYERWLEQGYGAYAFAMPASVVVRALRAGADSLYGLACAAFGAGRPSDILHVPGIVARLLPPAPETAVHHLAAATRRHLTARGLSARVEPMSGSLLPRVRVRRSVGRASVSVIIPVRDRADLLRRCLTSIEPARKRVACEVIVVDNGSSDPESRALLTSLRSPTERVLDAPGPFNYARLCNQAAEAATGDFLLMLNNDVEAVEPGWLDELLSRAADPQVDAVGAMLHWPSGVVQHAGIVLGPAFAASHAFDDRMAGEPGYGDMLLVANEPSAVTGACLLVRRSAYLAVGGMDALHFPVNYNDIDLCLRLRARGGTVVLSPHAQLRHAASSSRGRDTRPDQVRRYARELRALRARWGNTIADDPAYSPLLATSDQPYEGLACPPRHFVTRCRERPRSSSLPHGL